MDQLPTNAVWTVFIALAALVGWLVPSPWKLVEARDARFRQMEERHNQLLEKHNTLAARQIESDTRLTAEMRTLSIVLRELKATLKELTPAIRGQQRHESRD